MSCVVFECLACGHAGAKGFGGLHNASCPKCESTSISVEYDEPQPNDWEDAQDPCEEVENDY